MRSGGGDPTGEEREVGGGGGWGPSGRSREGDDAREVKSSSVF